MELSLQRVWGCEHLGQHAAATGFPALLARPAAGPHEVRPFSPLAGVRTHEVPRFKGHLSLILPVQGKVEDA